MKYLFSFVNYFYAHFPPFEIFFSILIKYFSQERQFIWQEISVTCVRRSSRRGRLRSTWPGTTTTPWTSTGGRTSCWPPRPSPRSWWTSWTRTAARCATRGPSPCRTPPSRGTSLTSPSSPTASGRPPSWPDSQPFRWWEYLKLNELYDTVNRLVRVHHWLD